MLVIKNIATGEIEFSGDNFTCQDYIHSRLYEISPVMGGWTPSVGCTDPSEDEDFSIFVNSDTFELGDLVSEIMNEKNPEMVNSWEKLLNCSINDSNSLEKNTEQYLDNAINSWEKMLETSLFDDEGFWKGIKQILKIDVINMVQ